MSKSLTKGLEPVQSYVSPKELKSIDKIAGNALRSRSDMIRLMLASSIDQFSKKK